MVFAAIGRILMQINSSLNPFIYASTIPAFKAVVKSYFACKFDVKMEQPGARLTYTFSSKTNSMHNVKPHSILVT